MDSSCPHQQKPECLSLSNRVHDRAAPTITIPEAVGQVMPSERREVEKKNSLCLLFFSIAYNPFFDFLLPSVTSKCQPAWETLGDLRSAGREPLKNLHDKILPSIHPDELLKSKMTFCNNTLRAAPEFSQMKRDS